MSAEKWFLAPVFGASLLIAASGICGYPGLSDARRGDIFHIEVQSGNLDLPYYSNSGSLPEGSYFFINTRPDITKTLCKLVVVEEAQSTDSDWRLVLVGGDDAIPAYVESDFVPTSNGLKIMNGYVYAGDPGENIIPTGGYEEALALKSDLLKLPRW